MLKQLRGASDLLFFGSVLPSITELASLGLLIGILFHLQRQHQHDNELSCFRQLAIQDSRSLAQP